MENLRRSPELPPMPPPLTPPPPPSPDATTCRLYVTHQDPPGPEHTDQYKQVQEKEGMFSFHQLQEKLLIIDGSIKGQDQLVRGALTIGSFHWFITNRRSGRTNY